MVRLAPAFSAACQVGVVGALFLSYNYRRTYGGAGVDPACTTKALQTFSTDCHRDVYDVAVVGGGIVGVATAREIRAKYPFKRVILLEREADVAQHQSGHNSGCIHAGMFYPPGSAMARLCPKGSAMMIAYCKANKLPYELCGKLIVATEDSQMPTVEELFEWGTANGVEGLEILRGKEAIQKKEPLVTGVGALYSKTSGIVDFAEVTRHMLKGLCTAAANKFTAKFQFEVLDFVGVSGVVPKGQLEELVLIRGREHNQLGPEKTVLTKNVITCCGMGNDRVAKSTGSVLEWIGKHITQTYGFRGRYYQLVPEKRDMVRMHVYPIPGEMLMLHFSPTVDVRRGKQIIVGPGCAVGFDPFGYTPYHFDLEYFIQCVFSKGGWTSLLLNFNYVMDAYYVDISKKAFLREAQRLIPSVRQEDIDDSFTGLMAVGVDTEGSLCMDLAMEFSRPRITIPATFEKGLVLSPKPDSGNIEPGRTAPLILNVRNAPSPAATASMAIAEEIVATAADRFKWTPHTSIVDHLRH